MDLVRGEKFDGFSVCVCVTLSFVNIAKLLFCE